MPRARRDRPPPQAHTLQLFDTDESLARSAATFLRGGRDGELLVVVATRKHWSGISSRLWSLGGSPSIYDEGRLTFWDAEDCLGRFMRRGEPNRALFAQCVANPVIGLTERAPKGVRIYGEMVELLAREANYTAAAQLEGLWNELGSQHPFTLLCGYSAAHFAGPDAGSALAAICCEHSHSTCKRSDPLGRFLLTSELMHLSSVAASP